MCSLLRVFSLTPVSVLILDYDTDNELFWFSNDIRLGGESGH